MLEAFRHKLNSFKELIGTTDNYTFYDSYYIETMNKLEHKCNVLENGGIETAIIEKHKNPIIVFLKRVFKQISNKEIDV